MKRPIRALLGAALCAPFALAQNTDSRLMLRHGAFDPLLAEPNVAAELTAGLGNRLHLVQFRSIPTQADRDAITAAGLEVVWYAPHDAYLVRGDAASLAALAARPTVRWTGAFHPGYKFDPALLVAMRAGELQPDRYIVVLADPRKDEARLLAAIQRIGGKVWRYAAGNILMEADLTAAQLRELAAEDTVLWLQTAEAPEVDITNARIQGGADTIESQGGTAGGFTGKGVRGHIMEGIFAGHPEFVANAWRLAPIEVFSNVSTTHGNSTFGEIFANGVDPTARALCPDGQGLATDYDFIYNTPPMQTGTNSRYGVVQAITDPAQGYNAMFETASWGYPRTLFYDARSAEMDWTIFDHDLAICQSQSNAGDQMSRPQAWAKNIISGGAIRHQDTATPVDDTQSGTSTGPATDGRIKPDLCGYYDNIRTTSGATTYTNTFNGTSGATPIIAGHLGLLLELYTDGSFGHQFPAGSDWTNRFFRTPHFTTSKALLINTARPYPHAQVGGRYRQGWGFPALDDVWNRRNEMLVLDELDVLAQGGATTYTVFVKPGTADLRVTMTFADLPAAAPFSDPHRVNDLSVLVTAPDGTVYHGNNGLVAGVYSTSGGSPDTIDTVENVFVQSPAAGVWRVSVSAPQVAMDSHVETAATDADFALVVNGIGGGRDTSGAVLDLQSTAPGDLRCSIGNLPAGFAEGFVFYSLSTGRDPAFGHFLGIEADSLSLLSLSGSASAGDPLHFSSGGAGQFPNAPFAWPTFVANLFSGVTLDAVAVFLDGSGNVIAVSSVDRVTVQ